MFLIDAIKLNVEKKIYNLFYFYESEAYKIKPVLFLFVLSLLAVTKKHYSKETREKTV